MKKDKSLVSVIIAIYNEREDIGNCLKAIKAQSHPIIEIIVVDNGSTDNSIEVVKNYADKIVSEKRKGITFAKNKGLRVAKGQFVATTDADCIPDKRWIEELVECFDDPAVASAGGANLTPQNASDFEKCIDFLLKRLGPAFRSNYVSDTKSITEIFHNPGCNVMYRKTILEDLEGFNEQLLTVEDEELDFRIRIRGYRILFTPFAKVYHNRKSNWKKFVKQVYRYAIGRAQFIKLHPKIAQWPRFIPSFIILFSLILFIIGIFNGLFFKILLIEMLIGIVGSLLVTCYLTLKSKKEYFFIYLFLLVLTFGVWGVGFIRGIWYRQKRDREIV